MVNDLIPVHGGDLQAAARRFGRPAEDWLDLSTGINPCAYPFTMPGMDSFRHLPYPDEALPEATRCCYGAYELPMLLAGSQQLIRQLPELLADAPLLAPWPGYREYAISWEKAGRQVSLYPAMEPDSATRFISESLTGQPRQHLLLINPNNPSGLVFSTDTIRAWAAMLAEDCVLICDEAFMDLTPEQSLLGPALPDNVLVLRSVGKFSGLAGIRIGAVFAGPRLMEMLGPVYDPWSINGPAQNIALQFFRDSLWQQQARSRIRSMSHTLNGLIGGVFSQAWQQADCSLFSSWKMSQEQGRQWYLQLAEQGILTRPVALDNEHILLRMGLMDTADVRNMQRFEQALITTKQSF